MGGVGEGGGGEGGRYGPEACSVLAALGEFPGSPFYICEGAGESLRIGLRFSSVILGKFTGPQA